MRRMRPSSGWVCGWWDGDKWTFRSPTAPGGSSPTSVCLSPFPCLEAIEWEEEGKKGVGRAGFFKEGKKGYRVRI